MIFHVTSALNGFGVEELFKNIGKKLVGEMKENEVKEEVLENETNEKITLDIKKVNEAEQKKYCCSYF